MTKFADDADLLRAVNLSLINYQGHTMLRAGEINGSKKNQRKHTWKSNNPNFVYRMITLELTNGNKKIIERNSSINSAIPLGE